MKDFIVSGAESKLFMRFEKAKRSAQGMGIWDHRAFILYDTGWCSVFNLQTRSPKALDVFKLGSFNEGTPTKDYLNHANDCVFSKIHYQDNPIPLLYVTIGTGTGMDEDGYFYRCAVENITCTVDENGEHYEAQTLQTISYRPEGIENTPFIQPCWGCPGWMIDPEAPFLYMFSAKYRTKKGCVPEGEHNTYIITKFNLPSLDAGSWVHLTPADIVDQFTVESDVPFTQGGTIVGGKLYYTFGLPHREYHDIIMVLDLKEKKQILQVEQLDAALNQEEIECAAPYQGMILVNTNGHPEGDGTGGIYVVKVGENLL